MKATKIIHKLIKYWEMERINNLYIGWSSSLQDKIYRLIK